MKYETATILIAFFGLSAAAPTPERGFAISLPRAMLRNREVPQEHSHNRFLDGVRTMLNKNNPAKIADPVFGLLGDAAAKGGAGSITNLACLHQATADQAFTNAKAAGSVVGMSDALLYAALERNTQGVGTASAACTDAAVNPEIGAIKQHQDPASAGAAAGNKAIVLELAKQLQSIGADPQEALLSGTFQPGNKADSTGKGNTCDTINDTEGCIFSQNLLVDDATAAEITAAVAGVAKGGAGGAAAAAAPAAAPAAAACAAPGAAAGAAKGGKAKGQAAAPAPAAAAGNNVQTFTGNLGGSAPPVIQSSGARPFSVNGSTFVNKAAALQRSCSVQNTACSNAANSGALAGKKVSDCNAQEAACNAA